MRSGACRPAEGQRAPLPLRILQPRCTATRREWYHVSTQWGQRVAWSSGTLSSGGLCRWQGRGGDLAGAPGAARLRVLPPDGASAVASPRSAAPAPAVRLYFCRWLLTWSIFSRPSKVWAISLGLAFFTHPTGQQFLDIGKHRLCAEAAAPFRLPSTACTRVSFILLTTPLFL